VNFRKSTEAYEEWLSQELDIVPEDLAQKHRLMREAIFPFFRATFYRWAQLWPEICPECAKAPELLAVGDLHVENFGTWRDVEGRLIWGVNDFDEACPMPYTIDLVRLAASTHLAIDSEQLRIAHGEACSAILSGYKACLEAGGQPWVLGGKHEWLYQMVKPSLRAPALFWRKLESLPTHTGRVPRNARRGLSRMMPGDASQSRIVHRVAGMGSLGRQRFVALATYNGGPLCREAKALAPSAWDWAREVLKRDRVSPKIRYQKALDTAVRAADPFVRLQGKWIVRRLAPDCCKIDLAAFPREKDETRLLHAMGWETANLHLGARRTGDILADLSRRRGNWLHKSAEKMVLATHTDWKEWRKSKR
jgi:Uncharacterized protein conserved in bacteria (DUF2252)